jgi:hypothetical protein
VKNLYKNIINRLATDEIAQAYLEGYNLGLARGNNSSHNKMVHKLESLGIEKFNDTALILGFNKALELVKESK